jgi:hypothetical protein
MSKKIDPSNEEDLKNILKILEALNEPQTKEQLREKFVKKVKPRKTKAKNDSNKEC